MHDLMKSADKQDSLVVCEDGIETSNEYPIWMACEWTPDTKTPTDWINGIAFLHKFNNQTCKVSLILKKGGGKYPWI